MDVPPNLTVSTMRRAFSVGAAAIRAHFFVYCLQGAFLLLVVVPMAGMIGYDTRHHLAPSHALGLQLVFGVLMGLLTLGLYRSAWDGLSQHPVMFRRLFWAFGQPRLWQLPILSSVLGLATSALLPVSQGHFVKAPSTIVGILVGLLLIDTFIQYAYAYAARSGTDAVTALQQTVMLLRPGKKRWLFLPIVTGFVLAGAVLVILVPIIAVVIGAAYFHVSKALMVEIVILTATPLFAALFVVAWPWVAAVMVAAAENLKDTA